MSIRVMSEVFDESAARGNRLLVLVILADTSNDDGVAWPKIATVARKSRLSERGVQKIIKELEAIGELRVYEGGFLDGKNQSSTYHVLTGRTKFTTPERENVHLPPEPRFTPGGEHGGTTENHQKEPSVERPTEGDGASAAASGVSPQSLPGLEPPVPPEQSASGAQGPREAALRGVWSHYVAVFGHKLRIKDLTPPRSRTISKALSAVGAGPDADETAIYAAMDLCIAAIDGLASYRSKHTSGSTDVSISVIFETGPHSRSSLTDQIEWWAKQAADQASLPPSIPSVHRERVMEMTVAVLKLERESVSDSVRERGEQAMQILAERFKVKVHGDGTGRLKRFEVLP